MESRSQSGRSGAATGWMVTFLVTTYPVRSLDNQAEVLAGSGSGFFEGFFFGRMPKKNRITLKRLTSRSYRAMIKAKET